MPNWCSNSMILHGPEDQVRSILDAVRHVDGADDKNLKFTKFMPQPTDENGELLDGTSWQYDNWGTKWGDCDTDIIYEEYDNGIGSASVGYSTAWGPMTGLVKEISRLHPGVTIDVEYEEPGMNFFGVEQFVGGRTILERHVEYDFESGKIVLPDGWETSFDTDWDDEDQDPSGTLNDAIHAAMERLWNEHSLFVGEALAGEGKDYVFEAGAPTNEGTVQS